MKKVNKILVLLGVVGLMGTTVQAADLESEMTVIESSFVEESSSTIDVYSMTRGTYLLKGTATITNPNTGYVGASVSTTAKMYVPTVTASGSLQVYKSGSWTTVASFNASTTNSAYAGVDKLYSVTRGYYYRVYSVHTANGESLFAATSGIYIS